MEAIRLEDVQTTDVTNVIHLSHFMALRHGPKKTLAKNHAENCKEVATFPV